MKKIIGMLLIALFVGMLCGCTRDDSGRVTYQLRASKLKLSSAEDIKRWEKIEAIYAKELKAIEGATTESGMGCIIQMEGEYAKTDAAVIEACRVAEKEATSITISQGYIVLEVSATYWSGAKSEVIYSHTFGNP